MKDKPFLSVIVPLYNEAENVRELHSKIVAAVQKLGRPARNVSRSDTGGSFEIIFIDDGSQDNTLQEARTLSPLKIIVFRTNFGQTAAFDAGFKVAQGEVVVTLDGDLQNDPEDIPLLLEQIDHGYDIVSGWRYERHDSLGKRIFSRTANLLRTILVKDGIHDSGCSLKAYRRECLEDLDLFGEMHRFIPALLKLQGFKVTEVKVSHHPRLHGTTKYNWRRGIKGFVDMLTIWFWRRYANRPVHLFGGSGVLLTLAGCAILLWMAVEKIFYGASIADRIWPLIGIFFLLAGIQLFIFGLLADILVRSYYKNRHTMNYTIREIREQ